jgi:hypothetical protein
MKPAKEALTRREFARRAALGTVAVAGDPAAAWSALRANRWSAGAPAQTAGQAAKLSPQSQAEVENRHQAILAQYPDRFSDAQKADLKHVCLVTQQSLDRLRAFTVANADQPALYLKPIVERQKRTNAPPNLKSAAPAAPGKPAANGPVPAPPGKP